VIIATGSEVWLAEGAAALLEERGQSVRVVSMPCTEAFLAQDDAYRTSVLGGDLPTVSIEAGSTFGWERFTGRDGLRIGIDRFGVSAPADVIAREWGFTPESVAARVTGWLGG
jgi:transketolase